MNGLFVLFFLFLLVFLGMTAYIIIQGVGRWTRNNNCPVETLQAVVVAKRLSVSGGGNNTAASTNYYVTFEYEDDTREEFCVKSRDYGEIAEGDRGLLTRQGTRFYGFERQSDKFTAEDPARAWHRCRSCGAAFRGTVCEYCGTPADD